jgi:DNA repair protein RecO (recombination protein O)
MIEAIVIRTLPLREHDRLVVLYCRGQGRTAAVARGALRATSRQGAALDDGNLIRCRLVPGRSGVPVMTGAQVQRSWTAAKHAPLAWAVGAYFLEAVDAAVYDGQPDEALWNALASSLQELDAGQEPLAVLRNGQVRLLEALGYGRVEVPAAGPVRTALDDRLERIVQRRLTALNLAYQLAK